MGLFSEKFDKHKLKSNLKMAITRINLQKQKTQNNIKLSKRQIAELLKQQKDESARIKVENVIREDYMIEAFELLELFCDLLSSRIQLIDESKSCPHDLKEAVSTVIWAAPRMEIPEFLEIRKQLSIKYGKEFALAASDNRDLSVNQRVMFKLGVKVPEPYLCIQYLKEIAREFNVDWDENNVLSAAEVPLTNSVITTHFEIPPPPSNFGDFGSFGGGAPGGGAPFGGAGALGGGHHHHHHDLHSNPTTPAGLQQQPQLPQQSSALGGFPTAAAGPTPSLNDENPFTMDDISLRFAALQQQTQQQQQQQQQQQSPMGNSMPMNMPQIPSQQPTISPFDAPLGGGSRDVGGSGGDAGGCDFDDLQARFEALKRRD